MNNGNETDGKENPPPKEEQKVEDVNKPSEDKKVEEPTNNEVPKPEEAKNEEVKNEDKPKEDSSPNPDAPKEEVKEEEKAEVKEEAPKDEKKEEPPKEEVKEEKKEEVKSKPSTSKDKSKPGTSQSKSKPGTSQEKSKPGTAQSKAKSGTSQEKSKPASGKSKPVSGKSRDKKPQARGGRRKPTEKGKSKEKKKKEEEKTEPVEEPKEEEVKVEPEQEEEKPVEEAPIEQPPEEDEEDQRILYLVDKMVDSQFIQSRNDPKLTDEVTKELFDFLDFPEKSNLYLKINPNTQDIIYKENLNELYSGNENEFNFCFFIKKDPQTPIFPENIADIVIYDYVYGNINRYLLDKMNENLAPQIFNLNWPEGIKNDLISNMHKFLMVLSHSYYYDQKKIVLYIPKENLSNPEEAIKDKELVARLEAIMIEWTNQIRDFLSNQENASNREDFDVNEEIEYLESRNENLTYISEQLENRELQDIVHILEKTRSNSENLKGFVNLQSIILDERKKALDIHKFLKILKEPCDNIKKPTSEIKDIPIHLKDIMHKIRVITEYCESFDTPEKVADLIKKVSFQLIHKFTAKIEENIKNIKTEYNPKLHENICDIKECISEWKKIYNNTKDGIKIHEKDENLKARWVFEQKDYQSIFYELETFEKRCLNLEEICLCQLQFGKNKDQVNQPIWGGTKRIEISKQLKDIEEKFDDKMEQLFHEGSNVLNTKVNKWQEDFRMFSKHVEDLEDMYKNTISSAFKRVNTIEEAVNTVENFYSLAKLPKIKNYIKNDIALEVIFLYTNEIEQMRAKNDAKSFVRLFKQTTEGGNALWSKYLSIRMDDYKKAIDKMNQIFIGKNGKEELPYMKNKKMEDLKLQIKQLDASLKSYLQGDYQGVKDEIEVINKINETFLMEKLKHPLITKYEPQGQFGDSTKIFFPLYQCNYPIELLKYTAIVNCYSRFDEFNIPPEVVKRMNELENQKRGLRELVINTCREYNQLVMSVKKETERTIFQDEFNKLINENISRLQNVYWSSQSGYDSPISRLRKKIDEIAKKINEFKHNSLKINDICEQISKKQFFHIEKNSDIYTKDEFVSEQENVCKQTSEFINDKAKEIIGLLMKSYSFIENVEENDVFKGFKAYIEEISEKGFNDALERALTNSIISMHRAMLGDGNNSYLSAFFRVDILLANGKFKKENYIFEPTEPELRDIINGCTARMKTCAENSPDIYSMFTKENANFVKKIEKKKVDDKNARANLNSLNAIQEVQEKQEKDAGKGKGRKGDKKGGKPERILPNFLAAQREEKEKARFPKAEEARKIFNNDLKANQLDKMFTSILTPWQTNTKLRPLTQILQEEENVRKINGDFKGFLQEGNSESLISALNDYIMALNRLKTDDLSNADSSEIPPTIISKLFIQFDSTKVKNKLIELCEEIIMFDLKYITKKTREELIDKVNQEFNEHELKFRREPETQDEWKMLWDELAIAEKEKEDRFKKITGASDVVNRVIGTNQINRANDDLFKEVENLEKRKDKYSQLLEDAKKILNDARNKLSSQVAEQEKKFIEDVDEMQRNFMQVIPDQLDCKLQEEIDRTYAAQKILKKFSDRCEALEKEEKSVNKGITLFFDIFHKTPTANKTLVDVKDQIKELNKIWNIKEKMNEIVKGWRETQFYNFNLVQMEKDRAMIENSLRTECKELQKKPIYITMKEQLDLYQALISVLELLRDDAMSENSASHWEKVQLLLGLNQLEPNATDFNFEKIIELKLEMYRDQIEKIVEYAREQQKLDRGLEAIKEEWKKKELKFEFRDKDKDKDGDFKLLAENKAWVDALENHLAKIAEYKSTPYYEDFKTKIDELETDLNKFSDLFQLLKQVQDKRNYLKNIFSKDLDDIYQQAGHDIAVYKTNNEKFIEICSEFAIKKLVRECFLQPNLENELQDLFLKFSDVERSMNSLLDTKRQTFKRFYFLSNDDLFELMGNSSDTKVINPHLSKLFSGIEKIKIEPSESKKKDDNPIIKKVYDSLNHGEKLTLSTSVVVISMVETWMNDLEKAMIDTLEKKMSNAFLKYYHDPKSFELDLEKNEISTLMKEKLKINDQALNGQCLLTMTQYIWRRKIENELTEAMKNEKKNIEWDNHINYLSTAVAKAAAYLEKKRKGDKDGKAKTQAPELKKKYILILYNYILLMKYLWELTANLKNENVRGTDNYEWLKLLKINFVSKKDAMPQQQMMRRQKNVAEDKYIVQIEQLNNKLNYGYEFIGNKERLVITNLTERCFLNMMTAIFYCRGGSLQGPAGTGKTETIKDLSRTLAKYVIVFNCSNKNSYNTMATLFLGVINTGAWVCFDEFNRIEIEVLSVIRIQLITIYDALRAKATSIPFKGNAGVRVNHSLAIFITMNPQYIFRSELPENLKSLFRPVTLKAADRQRICEIKFLADGYQAQSANTLAKLLIVSIDVLEQQLSHQPHYDFSLRAVMGILKHASLLKNSPGSDETFVLRMAICEMLKPKLVYEDEEIFDNALASVFNDGLQSDGSNINEKTEQVQLAREETLREEIKKIIDMKKLTGSPFLVNQVIQLYNNMIIKHGIMLVGGTCSGKSTTIKLLQALNKVKIEKNGGKPIGNFSEVEIRTIFPKSIELDELYGRIGSDSTYIDGLLPYHLKDISNTRYDDDKTKIVKWLVLDAPVDTLWIESLNTLLDDTKMLSLPSGFRINLKADVKVVFEAESLTQATPATISRVGLIYFEAEKLSWFVIARKWLDEHKASKDWYEFIAKWFEKYVYGILEELEKMNLNYLININSTMLIMNLIKIFDAFIDELSSISPENLKQTGGDDQNGNNDNAKYWELAERLFVFALMWSIGGPLDEQGRIQIDSLIRKYAANFPANTMIFDFFVNPDKDEWGTWEDKMIQGWTPSQNSLYKEIFVPTIDITRNKTIIQNLLKNNQSPFIIGGIATGKTSIIKMIYNSIERTKYQPFDVTLSYGISTRTLQKCVEVNFERRNNKLYPPSNKKSICYVDDLNLPKEDQFGCQTIVEMLRQFMELEGWYSVDTLNYVNIKSMLLMASTCIRNQGEKSNITSRFLSKFVPVCLQNANDQVKHKIFSTLLGFYFSNSQSEDVKKLNDSLSLAVIGLYNSVINFQDYQPTPSKCHYVFNMHDITKVFEAISKVKESSYFTKEYFVKIFVHEAFRTFSDRFLKQEDKSHFKEMIARQLETNLGMTFNDTLMKEQRDCVFIDSFTEPALDGTIDKKPRTYEEISEFDELKKMLLSKIEAMHKYQDMVFFDEAIYNVFFLRRIIYKNCGGHGLLIGLGSSGKTSYVKIASDLCGYKTVQFNGAKDSNGAVWLDHIKKVIREAGGFNKPISLVIKERDISNPLVIEHIHYLLTIGMIPNLYTPQDWEEMKTNSGNASVQTMTTEQYINEFKKNLRDNVRIFMTFSPLGEKLKTFVRKYPSIIDHTTSISFTDWPETALKEVANKFIDTENLIIEKKKHDKKKEDKKEKEEKKEEKKEEEEKKEDELDVDEEEKEEKISLLLSISDVFAQMHLGVTNNVIEMMKREMKREAYFTSQNFITLIKTFNKFLKDKVKAINSNIEKYRSGIQKIQLGKIKIEEMKAQLEERGKEESIKNRENEKLLEEIQEKKKNAIDSGNEVKFQREKNEKNRAFFEKNKADSEKEMNAAKIPMYEAIKLVNERINRQKLSEFKSMSECPKETKNVFFALMAIFNKPQTWEQVRFYLRDISFDELKDVEHLQVTEKGNFTVIQKYSKDFDLDVLRKQSMYIPDLALYVQNVEKYFKAKWVADVKLKNFMEANKKVLESMQNLEKLEKQLAQINAEIEALEKQLNEGKENLARIKSETNAIKEKLIRASSLTSAFEKEEERWGSSLTKNQELLKNVLGNTILASGYLTYFGVFPGKYRDELRREWASILSKKNIVFNTKFDFLHFISNANEIQNWKIYGLPDDLSFVENAIIMQYSLSPSLLIDPQDQALDWMKKMLTENTEDSNSNAVTANDEHHQHSKQRHHTHAKKSEKRFIEVTPQQNGYLMLIRENITKRAVIINNVDDYLPPELEEFLKTIDKSKNTVILRTKVPNPKFYPEVSTATNIINFLVNEKGLEEQLLSAVVRIEREETELQIKNNIKTMFDTQRELDKYEENTLMKLTNAGDNYLEDDLLIKDLENSTQKSTQNQELIFTTSTEIEKINASREEYRPLARKVSKYFFVLYSMNNINNMYEFSLKQYISLFEKSVKLSNDSRGGSSIDSSEDRIKAIEKIHLQRIINYANQCLFENHKLIFALQLCLATIFANDEEKRKDLEKKGMGKYINTQSSKNEDQNDLDDLNKAPKKTSNIPIYDFFNTTEFNMLLNNIYEPGDEKMIKPTWLNDKNAWNFLISLEKIPDLKGIVSSFTHNSSDWHKWYQNKDIEELPVEWESKCKGTTNVRKLLFIKALRPDKIADGIRDFINKNLDVDLKEQGANLREIIKNEVNPETPLMIVHGSGVEPSDNISMLWEEFKPEELKKKEQQQLTGQNEEEEKKGKQKGKDEKEKEKEKEKEDKNAKDKDKDKEDKEKEIKPRCVITTLNQDQWQNTRATLKDMAKVGGWVYVANTHLTLQSIPDLEKTLDDIKLSNPHPNFKLIISTNPHPNYPISLLQRCNKITFELPKGIGNNMARLFDDLSKETLPGDSNVINKYEKNDIKQSVFAKLVYSLAMFHSMLIERRKYKGYGWTKFYDFNNSDFKICFDILRTYSKSYVNPQDFPWKAIQELIAVNYGSRFTNPKDLELLSTYSEHFFNANLLIDKNYNLSCNPDYFYPLLDDSLFEKYKNTTTSDAANANKSDFYLRMCFFKEESKRLRDDPPEVFGLHFNAEISSQIHDNLELLDNVRILNSDIVVGGEYKSTDDVLMNKIKFAKEKIPKPLETDKKKFEMFDNDADKGDNSIKYNPINNLLYQEAEKYNKLISIIKNDLVSYEKALKGHITITASIVQGINALTEDKIPQAWLCMYLSTKTFMHFLEDLNQRVEFFRQWITNGLYTPHYYLGYFTNPIAFITAIKQRFSLLNKVAYNNVTLQFKVINDVGEDKSSKNSNGYSIKGIMIEGGCWDKKNMGIKDEGIQDLYNPLPPIIITPTAQEDRLPNFGTASALSNENSVEVTRNFPLYYIPIRGDYLARSTYVMDITLNIVREKDKDGMEKTREEILSYWIKKGTCLLLSKTD